MNDMKIKLLISVLVWLLRISSFAMAPKKRAKLHFKKGKKKAVRRTNSSSPHASEGDSSSVHTEQTHETNASVATSKGERGIERKYYAEGSSDDDLALLSICQPRPSLDPSEITEASITSTSSQESWDMQLYLRIAIIQMYARKFLFSPPLTWSGPGMVIQQIMEAFGLKKSQRDKIRSNNQKDEQVSNHGVLMLLQKTTQHQQVLDFDYFFLVVLLVQNLRKSSIIVVSYDTPFCLS